MRIVFMGTPDFSVGALEALIEAGHEVVLAVTQPDRRRGRGKEVSFSPVKEAALSHEIPVYQPERLRGQEAVSLLKEQEADVFVVAAFGQILREEILSIPPYGCINIHASLLPKYRGAAPIQQAILDGEKETGITIMQMDVGMDTGDILYQEAIRIAPKETGGTLFQKLAELGATCIVKTLALLEKGQITPRQQKEEFSSKVPKLTKEMGRIDWTRKAEEIERQIRGLNPWPGAFTNIPVSGGDGRGEKRQQLKIWEADLTHVDSDKLPGTVISGKEGELLVQTGSEALKITKLQQEGRKRMDAADFLNGSSIRTDCVLGEEGEN